MATHAGVCPVCGMALTGSESAGLEWEGVTYRFCSEACKQEFLLEPEAYQHDEEGDETE